MCIKDSFINMMMDTTTPSSPSGVASLSMPLALLVEDEREGDNNSDDSDWDLAGGSEVGEENVDTDDKDDKMPDPLEFLDGDDDSGLEDWDMV